MVQRYGLCDSYGDCSIDPEQDGEFVRYEDYLAVELELAEAKAKLASDRWCKQCGVYHDPELGEVCPNA
jgi:hypothetical protein